MRTVIVFDALSEITTPWRTRRDPCWGECTAASSACGPLAAARSFAFARSFTRRARRRSALAARSARRSAWRSSGERGGRAWTWRARDLRRRSLGERGSPSSSAAAAAGVGSPESSPDSADSSRSRATVSARARSRRARPRLAVSSSSPVAFANRSPKTSLRSSAICLSSSGSSMSRISRAFIEASVLAHDELRFHRQLVRGESDRVARERLGHACELEHHAPRLDDRDPAPGPPLARAQARLGGLLRHGLVGEDVDPALAATLDLARHRDTRSLDLAVGQPAALERLQTVLAELHLDLATRRPGAAAAV